jgi:hypothetical protein
MLEVPSYVVLFQSLSGDALESFPQEAVVASLISFVEQ